MFSADKDNSKLPEGSPEDFGPGLGKANSFQTACMHECRAFLLVSQLPELQKQIAIIRGALFHYEASGNGEAAQGEAELLRAQCSRSMGIRNFPLVSDRGSSCARGKNKKEQMLRFYCGEPLLCSPSATFSSGGNHSH